MALTREETRELIKIVQHQSKVTKNIFGLAFSKKRFFNSRVLEVDSEEINETIGQVNSLDLPSIYIQKDGFKTDTYKTLELNESTGVFYNDRIRPAGIDSFTASHLSESKKRAIAISSATSILKGRYDRFLIKSSFDTLFTGKVWINKNGVKVQQKYFTPTAKNYSDWDDGNDPDKDIIDMYENLSSEIRPDYLLMGSEVVKKYINNDIIKKKRESYNYQMLGNPFSIFNANSRVRKVGYIREIDLPIIQFLDSYKQNGSTTRYEEPNTMIMGSRDAQTEMGYGGIPDENEIYQKAEYRLREFHNHQVDKKIMEIKSAPVPLIYNGKEFTAVKFS